MAEMNLFDKENKKKTSPVLSASFTTKVNELSSRLKIIEERFSRLLKRAELIENNMLNFERDLRSDFKALNSKNAEFRKNIKEMQSKVEEMGSELDRTANKYELKVLDRYIDLWQPMHFITKDEAELIISKLKRE